MSGTILGRIDPAQFGSTILSNFVVGHLQAAYRSWGYLAALACTTPPDTRMLLALSSATWDQLAPDSEQMI